VENGNIHRFGNSTNSVKALWICGTQFTFSITRIWYVQSETCEQCLKQINKSNEQSAVYSIHSTMFTALQLPQLCEIAEKLQMRIKLRLQDVKKKNLIRPTATQGKGAARTILLGPQSESINTSVYT